MIKLTNILHKTNIIFSKIEKAIMLISSILIILLTLASSINRYFLKYSISAYEELTIILFTVLIFWGTSNVARGDNHLTVSIITDNLKVNNSVIYSYLDLFIKFFCLVASVIGIYSFLRLVSTIRLKTAVLRLPYSYTIFFGYLMPFIFLSITYLYKVLNRFDDLIKKYNMKK